MKFSYVFSDLQGVSVNVFKKFKTTNFLKMQLKMPRDRKEWIKFLRTENDYMTYLLEAFEVPETIEGKCKNKYKKNHLNAHVRFF